MRKRGFDCKNWRVAWSKIEYFRDKIFYKEINSKGYGIIKLENLKKYIRLKIKEKKREWSAPKIVTISIIAAIGYSFLNIYLDKLHATDLIIAFKVFLVFSLIILSLEFMVRSMIASFGKQDKYNQLLSSIEITLIHLKNKGGDNNILK